MGGVGERPSEGAGHSLRGERELHSREAGANRDKNDTCLSQEGKWERSRLSSEANKTREGKKGEKKKNKWEGFAKASLSHAKDDGSLVIHHLYPGSSGIPSFRDSLPRSLRANSRGLNERDGGESSFKSTPFFRRTASRQLFSSCFVFVDLRRLLG